MRTIKFRAFMGTYMDYFEIGDIFGWPTRRKVARGQTSYPLMQFTGLKDKNGKEIFEGDVVRAWEPETETTTGELRMIIDDALNCYAPLRDMLIDKKDVEVIGNIYQNPELKK